MKISVVTKVPYARDEVYAAMRDALPEMVPFMPNVASLTVEAREEVAEGEFKLLNRWQAAETEIPKMARSFVDQSKTFWLDHAHWTQEDWGCRWSLEMGFMTDRVSCQGQTRYTENEDGHTEMHIEGELEINLKGMMPGFLARKAKPGVEGFVVKLVAPNFAKTAEAVTKYLDAQKAEPDAQKAEPDAQKAEPDEQKAE